MKKVGFLLLLIFCFVVSRAQGIYNLWGITPAGGGYDLGAIFSTDVNGSNFQKQYAFNRTNAGSYGSHLTEYNGKFYGTTYRGGDNDLGTIFEWDPTTNTHRKMFDFDGINGDNPNNGLTLWRGKFYGTTRGLSANNNGIIFEWNPETNEYKKRYELSSTTNVQLEWSELILYNDKFYGLASGVSTFYGTGDGSIYEWDPVTNIYTNKFEFNNLNGTIAGSGKMVLSNGKFYGTTYNGGIYNYGIIFEWNPITNVYVKRIDFDNALCRYPISRLIKNGEKFYGLALRELPNPSGGTMSQGIFYEWDPLTNAFAKKFDFISSSGSQPVNDITLYNGKIYGTTELGGTDNYGTLYEWDPTTNAFIKHFDFNPTSGRGGGSRMAALHGKLFATKGGGNNNSGLIYEFDPTTNGYIKKFDFNNSQGIYPTGSLVEYNGKLYGMTRQGGTSGIGVIYEWDHLANVYSVKFNLTDRPTGSNPTGSLRFFGGKFYGITDAGGSNDAGTIFEWDPITNVYTKKIDFYEPTGWKPIGNLVLRNDKFYGMTFYGGANDKGVIFEWDPVTNVYTKKIDFGPLLGNNPSNSLTLYEDKFYGTTSTTLFEWEPETNIFIKKFQFNDADGTAPRGTLSLKDGKFYGGTSSGGANWRGTLFEWDPETNVFTKKRDFDETDGQGFGGSLVLRDEKFYGIASSSFHPGAVVFEWDPAANIYIKKSVLRREDGGSTSGGLTVLSAPVSKGSYGSCLSFPSVTIDNSNNNTWVPIIDNDGNAVAEIKANGNNLGVVSSSMFINDAPVREDGAKRLYLDRNFTITPQLQPSTPVDIRLYIRSSEYLILKNAINSNGQPSGINSVTDISIFKNPVNICSSNIAQIANPVTTTVANWENDYVLSASITSFSSFYFANKAFAALPLNLLEFKGRLENNNGALNWKTDNEQNTSHFEIERSTDGQDYKVVGVVSATNVPGTNQYKFIDPLVTSLNSPIIYYRLKQIDLDHKFTYSQTVQLKVEGNNSFSLYPNPATGSINLFITNNAAQRAQLRIIDRIGRIVKQQQCTTVTGSTTLSVDLRSLSPGIYSVELLGETVNERKQFVKQ